MSGTSSGALLHSLQTLFCKDKLEYNYTKVPDVHGAELISQLHHFNSEPHSRSAKSPSSMSCGYIGVS